jgi:hypothetical protein
MAYLSGKDYQMRQDARSTKKPIKDDFWRKSRRLFVGLAMSSLGALAAINPAVASTGQSAQRASEALHHAAIASIALQLDAFDYAAQEWSTANGPAWNVDDSTVLAGGAPTLLYVGPSSLCGAPSDTGKTVDMVAPATYLPADLQVPLSGALCAMVYPASATSGQTGESTYGSPVIGDTLVLGYFVPGPAATEPGGILYGRPPAYLQGAVFNRLEALRATNAVPVENRNGWVTTKSNIFGSTMSSSCSSTSTSTSALCTPMMP